MFDNVQKAASQEQLAQDVRLIRVTHQSTPLEDGKGQHVNVVV